MARENFLLPEVGREFAEKHRKGRKSVIIMYEKFGSNEKSVSEKVQLIDKNLKIILSSNLTLVIHLVKNI